MIVADTGLVVHLLLPTDRSPEADAVFLRDSEWAAPRLWRSEFRNVLATQQRTGALELARALELVEDAVELLGAREYEVPSGPVLHAAAESGCTAYDAEFVVLARDLGAPLVTTDRKLADAFPGVAVSPRGFVGEA